MPALDIYHDQVKNALIKDGWTITDDPLTIRFGRKVLYVDLAAQRLLAAERAGSRIAVEIKSFVGRSDVLDLEQALGQFVLYAEVLAETDPIGFCISRLKKLPTKRYLKNQLASYCCSRNGCE